MLRLLLFSALLGLSHCARDETVSAYGGAGVVWTLAEIDGMPAAAPATLSFPEPGRIAGQAPCNGYSGRMEAPYPWFEITGLAVTRRACAALAEETRFLDALAAMTLVEVSGDVLILSDETGREMVFRSGG